MKPLPLRPARGLWLARPVAAFAFVLLAEALLMRRFDLLSTPTLVAVAAVAGLSAILALLALAAGLRDIWRNGVPGAGRAMLPAILVVVTLAPFAGIAASALVHPPLTDVSTDLADPPALPARPPAGTGIFALLDPRPPPPGLQAATHPDLASLRVPLSTVEAHAAAHFAALELGWTILSEEEPEDEASAGRIVAATRSLVLGLPDDAVVRVVPDPDGARIDVRLATRELPHDFGTNADRVKAFLATFEDILRRPAAG